MSVKIVSPKAELAVLRGMTNKNKVIAGTLLGAVDEGYFDSPESVEIFHAIRKQMTETGEPPKYRLLLEDTDLSKEARSFLRDSEATIQTVVEAKKGLKILNRYRQLRGMYELAVDIDKKLQQGKVDIDELMDESSRRLAGVRTSKTHKDAVLHFGTNNNSKDFVKDLIYGDKSENVIVSGIPPFDAMSGGFLRGSLITIGASSGGGKSLLANHMCATIPLAGYNVLIVPLEMSKQETTARIIANRSRQDVTKILTGKLATGEMDLAYKKYEKWAKKVKKAGGRLTIFKPDEDMSIEEIFAATNAYDCDVRIIDYVGLLGGVGGDDQWQKLGDVGRVAKINAGATNTANVLLCQITEDGKIAYARALSHHSNNSFVWSAKKEEREKEVGRIRVEQPKARNSKSFPFELGFHWGHMRVVKVDKVTGDVGDVTEPMKNLADV